ncbi:group-specific protein [Bacillus massiliglaciei]|uniref:group-specific protein n=1 Tax=Bacillus massiliglaciei TaxID=1816693 RepID=UPI000ADE1458|nr:group-specific protein [Bacillus massiliglaciei]
MSQCSIDHSLEDVRKKLESQKDFLPEQLLESAGLYLEKQRTQEELNELFHLLKKYDLVTEDERLVRNEKMRALMN